MERILQILYKGSDSYGGIESFVESLYMHIEYEKVQFDWLFVNRKVVKHEEEFTANGARFFHIPLWFDRKMIRQIEFFFRLWHFLRKHLYHTVHIHNGHPTYLFYLCAAARLAGVKRIIVHAHSAQALETYRFPRLTAMLRWMLRFTADEFLACSELAGQRVFPSGLHGRQTVRAIHNGIDPERFRFDPAAREAYRKELGIQDCYVLGHVGRFSTEKNHRFLLNIFQELHASDPQSRLLLVGDGPLFGEIQAQIAALPCKDAVICLGARNDVAQLYSAMDVFVLPSLYEGFPVVGVEAAAAGLPVVMSDTITDELCPMGTVCQLPLGEAAPWADLLSKLEAPDRSKDVDLVRANHYDIRQVAKSMQEYYLQEM